MPVTLEQYTEKAIALFGDTEPIKDKIKALGGKYNSNLRGRPGWIFMNSSRVKVEAFIKSLESGEDPSIIVQEENQSTSKTLDELVALLESVKLLEKRVQILEKSLHVTEQKLLGSENINSDPEEEKPKRLLKRK